jgi:rhamnosyltransferase
MPPAAPVTTATWDTQTSSVACMADGTCSPRCSPRAAPVGPSCDSLPIVVRNRVALVIRCYNEEAHIGRLLAGAVRQTRPPDELIVVDSGSTDATRSIAETFGASILSLPPEQFSFGRSLNVGVSAASSVEFVVFASAHVYPIYDTWLERLLAPFHEHDIALTYGRQQPPERGRFSEQRVLAQWFPARSITRQAHPFCNNANAAIRRSVWQDLRYDETLTGLEDLDWGKRALQLGHSLSYVAEAPVVHVHDEPFRQVVNRYRREAIAHKQIYNEQHMGALTATRLAAMNVLGDYREATSGGLLARYALDIPRFRIAQFLGTYQGFAQSGPVTEALRRRFYYPASEAAQSPAHDADAIGHAIDYKDLAHI